MKRILLIFALLAAMAVVGLAVFWPQSQTKNLMNSPEQLYAAGDLSGTLAAIESTDAASLDSEQGNALRQLEAGCYRRLSQLDRMRDWLAEAEKSGVPAEQIQLQKELTDIQLGMFEESPMRLLRDLERRGAPSNDARSAVVRGALARRDYSSAERVLESWEAEQPADAEPIFLRGIMSQIAGQWELAERNFIKAIDRNPKFELAYLALSEFYAEPPNTNLARQEFVLQRLVDQFPVNAEARARLAGTERRRGKLNEARQLISSAESRTEAETLELAEIELDCGNFKAATELLSDAGLAETQDFVAMIDAAFAMSLQGQGNGSQVLTERANWGAVAWALSGRGEAARKIFDVALDRVARGRRFADLQIQWSLEPGNQTLAQAMESMLAPAKEPGTPTLNGADTDADRTHDLSSAQQLYDQHCSVCHGTDGNGFGPAARHLFPLPRNFRREPMRIVSAANRLATDADLRRTIRQGLPGASMPGFEQLTDSELQSLVVYVRELQRQGLNEQYESRSRDLQIDTQPAAAKRNAWIAARLEPSAPVELPPGLERIRNATADSDRSELDPAGVAMFEKVGCNQCHSLDYQPVATAAISQTELFDSLGRRLTARRLGRDVYRGGTSLEDIYRRIRLGIPGTPHPALETLEDEQWQQLVILVAKLGIQAAQHREERPGTNYARRVLSAD